jgi:malate dehydrogenase
LILKQNPAVSKLNLYDVVNSPGVAADLSHLNSKAKVTGFVGADQVNRFDPQTGFTLPF